MEKVKNKITKMWVVPDQKKWQTVIYGLYLFVFVCVCVFILCQAFSFSSLSGLNPYSEASYYYV